MIQKTIVLNADSYKFSQFNQYPAGTEFVSSYIESRGGKFEDVVFFGLQMFIKEYLMTPITQNDIDFADKVMTLHSGVFNREGWEYILREHGGKLPLAIEALPEGTITAPGNVLVQIINTDPNCWWLTSFVETALLRGVWYPTTVASNSFLSKKIIKEYLDETSDNPDAIKFMLHDFSPRGATTFEASGVGGIAHLINFLGTDNVTALLYAQAFYGADITENGSAFSVPAMEHSTVTSWTREKEVEAYRNMLRKYGKKGKIFSAVIDSYDPEQACIMWGTVLKDEVLASGAKLVVRPDSGDPVAGSLMCARLMAKYYGYKVNSKGYKVINNVGILYGDGINHVTIKKILQALKEAGFAADNMVFGQGGGLLQAVDRDTMRFAQKCSAAKVDGVWVDVYKDPVTDTGKRSKKGRLAAVMENGKIETVRFDDLNGRINLLVPVFRNGDLLVDQTLNEVRERVAI